MRRLRGKSWKEITNKPPFSYHSPGTYVCLEIPARVKNYHHISGGSRVLPGADRKSCVSPRNGLSIILGVTPQHEPGILGKTLLRQVITFSTCFLGCCFFKKKCMQIGFSIFKGMPIELHNYKLVLVWKSSNLVGKWVSVCIFQGLMINFQEWKSWKH